MGKRGGPRVRATFKPDAGGRGNAPRQAIHSDFLFPRDHRLFDRSISFKMRGLSKHDLLTVTRAAELLQEVQKGGEITGELELKAPVFQKAMEASELKRPIETGEITLEDIMRVAKWRLQNIHQHHP